MEKKIPENLSKIRAAVGAIGGAVKSERKAKAAAANLAGKRTGRKRLDDDQVSPAALAQRARRAALRRQKQRGNDALQTTRPA